MDYNSNRDQNGRFLFKPEILDRKCSKCLSTKTYVKKNGGSDWRHDKDGNIFCKKCYHKFIYYPKYGDIMHARYNKHRLNYPGQTYIYMWFDRLGICHDCCAVVGINCKKTDWHHAKGYVRCFPWYGIVELCTRCHDLEKWRLGEFKNNTGWYQKLYPRKQDPKSGKFLK